MGASSQPRFVSLENKDKQRCKSLWSKVLEVQSKRRRSRGCKKRAISLMKRRKAPRLQHFRRRSIETRVRRLKKLIPNTEPSMGLDGLFRQTAEYISSLQMRVKFMQVLVQALAAGSDE